MIKNYQILIARLAISLALYFGLREMKPTTEFDACVEHLESLGTRFVREREDYDGGPYGNPTQTNIVGQTPITILCTPDGMIK